MSIAYGLWIAQNIFCLYSCHGPVHCFSAWEIRTKNLCMCVEHLFIWKYCIEFFSCKLPFILSSLKIQVYLRNLYRGGLGCLRSSSGQTRVELPLLVRYTETFAFAVSIALTYCNIKIWGIKRPAVVLEFYTRWKAWANISLYLHYEKIIAYFWKKERKSVF